MLNCYVGTFWRFRIIKLEEYLVLATNALHSVDVVE